jgi:hypothetical protein
MLDNFPNSFQGAKFLQLAAPPKQINVAMTLPSSCRKKKRDEKGFFTEAFSNSLK